MIFSWQFCCKIMDNPYNKWQFCLFWFSQPYLLLCNCYSSPCNFSHRHSCKSPLNYGSVGSRHQIPCTHWYLWRKNCNLYICSLIPYYLACSYNHGTKPKNKGNSNIFLLTSMASYIWGLHFVRNFTFSLFILISILYYASLFQASQNILICQPQHQC